MKEFLIGNFKHKTKKGGVQIAPVFFLVLLIVGLILLFLYENVIAINKYSKFQNALDSSNLSVSRNINQIELARTGNITFKESDLPAAFETYKEHLIKNFHLNSDFRNKKGNTDIKGQVTIEDFRLYSVMNGKITEWQYIPSQASFVKIKDNDTNVFTPNNKPVQETSVYSEIKLTTFTVFKINEKDPSNPNTKELKIKSYIDLVKK